MNKPQKPLEDRRRDHAKRLKVAVRKAHDPLFTLLRSPPPR
jgi:hypothetical protein